MPAYFLKEIPRPSPRPDCKRPRSRLNVHLKHYIKMNVHLKHYIKLTYSLELPARIVISPCDEQVALRLCDRHIAMTIQGRVREF